jgi:hypothetical protein
MFADVIDKFILYSKLKKISSINPYWKIVPYGIQSFPKRISYCWTSLIFETIFILSIVIDNEAVSE